MRWNRGSAANQNQQQFPRAAVVSRRRKNRAVWIGRFIFLLCLFLAATALGLITFFLLAASEKNLAESQFGAIADRALDAAFSITHQKRLGTITMATMAANANPDPSQWPFVTIRGYEEIAQELIETSSGREMGFAPLVRPEQLSDFEDFAYDYYFNLREPSFPKNTTAMSSFGRGVWGVNPALNTSDNRYHESDGSTSYNSPNKIFAPILHHNEGTHKALMLNLHFQETRGVIIDNMIACAQKRKETAAMDLKCGAITDFLILTSQEFRPGPGALMMQPIYAAASPYELVGLLASSIIWDEVLTDVFTASVSGVDCVIQTTGGEHTYRITEGNVTHVGDGDWHDPNNDGYCKSTDLIDNSGEDSTQYLLKICPSEDFFDIYRTKNPCTASVGSVCIILFSAFVFLFYDRCVRKEFDARQNLLEAKRNFVRYVSHEVRTPLNSVCMGLNLLEAEMVKATTAPTRVENGKIGSEYDVEDWHSLIEEVYDNAQSSVNVLNDLLSYDKIEVGTFTLELELVSLPGLVKKTVKEFKAAAERKKIDLVCEVKDLAPELSSSVSAADPVRLSQVVRNLISNAIKFTPEEGKIEVCVTGEVLEGMDSKEVVLHGRSIRAKRGGTVILEVTDTGAGMSPEQALCTFQQGMQFNRNKLQDGQGSGLGLYIAKGIAEQHGGSLAVRSPGIGHGATFSLSLPVLHVIEDNAKNSERTFTNSSSEKAATTAVPSLRVLVVDDSTTNRRLLVRWLCTRGHICEEAADGVEALDMVQESLSKNIPYDTILMDYEMPRLNGPKAIKAIREAGCVSHIVGISGNVLSEDVDYFLSQGAEAVLSKPINFADLENLWREHGFSDRRINVLPV